MIKSFKKLNKRSSQPKSRENKSEIATITPKAIVKALYDYNAQGDDELSFRKDDFLYIVDNSDPQWFVACNPLSNTSGLVPVTYFEVIQRPEVIPSVSLSAAMTKSLETDEPRPLSSSAGTLAEPTARNRKSLALYGFVLYDFAAERNDELEAKRGESIIIIAQSNAEWFVAKPIGRLGGPGLIPVSYVQLREVGTDKPFENFQEAIKLAGIPQVDEWKRRAAEYKASSIPLGRFEEPTQPHTHTQQQLQQHPQQYQAVPPQQTQPVTVSQPPYQAMPRQQPQAPATEAPNKVHSYGSTSPKESSVYVKTARVDRFAINSGRYWYLVSVEMSNGKFRSLCRYYQDFYDFQIKLLEEFPEEAGRTGKQRTLPFMPGPLTLVNHSISSQRRANLDEYVRKLVCMPSHIARSTLISQLFSCRAGDIEGDEPSTQMPVPPEEETESIPEIERPSHQLQQPQYQYQRQSAGNSNTAMNTSQRGEVPPPLVIPTTSNTNLYGSNGGHTPQTATSMTSIGTSNTTAAEHVKVKVFHSGELIAIRVPVSLPFSDLYARISLRLGLEHPQLYTAKDFSGSVIDSDHSFRKAMVNGKIVLYAK